VSLLLFPKIECRNIVSFYNYLSIKAWYVINTSLHCLQALKQKNIYKSLCLRITIPGGVRKTNLSEFPTVQGKSCQLWTMKNTHSWQKPKNCVMQISSFVFIFKIKQKSGTPVLSLFTFSASFNNICSKKAVHCFNGWNVILFKLNNNHSTNFYLEKSDIVSPESRFGKSTPSRC
jgi:hypothetical protein